MSISLANAIPITDTLAPVKADEAMKERIHEGLAGMFLRVNAPEETTYAEVKVGDRVVATVTNSGYVQSSNALGGRVNSALDDDDSTGPTLAERRAQQIAQALGGTVVKADTAQTRAQWLARPAITWSINYTSLQQHGYDAGEHRNNVYESQNLAKETVMALLALNEV